MRRDPDRTWNDSVIHRWTQDLMEPPRASVVRRLTELGVKVIPADHLNAVWLMHDLLATQRDRDGEAFLARAFEGPVERRPLSRKRK